MRPTPMKRRLRPPERGWDRPLLKIELPGLTFIDYSFCVNFSCLVRAGGKKKTRAKMQKPKRGGKTSRHALQITADCTAHRARRHTQHAYHATHAEITVRLHHARAKRGQPHRSQKTCTHPRFDFVRPEGSAAPRAIPCRVHRWRLVVDACRPTASHPHHRPPSWCRCPSVATPEWAGAHS